MKVTLDTNAIIDLEESRPSATALRALIGLHLGGRLTLCVSKIAASERDRDPSGRPDYTRFLQRLAAVGLTNAQLLNPLGYFNVTFWDNCLFAGPADEALTERIWEILFPGWRGREDLPSLRALNALCDVSSMWCHISYGGEVFVTRDENFHKVTKKPALIALGAGRILNPDEALALFSE